MVRYMQGAVVVMVMMLCAGLLVAQAGQAARGGVAVVNVQQVFDQLTERSRLQADLQERLEKLKVESDSRQAKMKTLSDDLDMLRPGTAAHLAKQNELEFKAIEMRTWQEFQRQKIERENAVQLEGLYAKVVAACGQVARTNGFSLVLFEEPATVSGPKPDVVANRISGRKVIWASKELDLTDQVVQRMNLEFGN